MRPESARKTIIQPELALARELLEPKCGTPDLHLDPILVIACVGYGILGTMAALISRSVWK